jgi:D-xylonolactonase
MEKVRCIWDAAAELGEGVFWHAGEQAVYWVDILQSNLHCLGASGEQRSWHFPGSISAVMPCDSGGFVATFHNGLSHIDLETEQVTPLIALENDLPNNRFNDGCSDTLGQFWFGSMDNEQQQRSGRFYRMDREGEVHRLDAFGNICITNGPAFSTDGQWVFFTDTVNKKVFRAPLDEQGIPGPPQLHIDFTLQDSYPDGMCTDTAGGLWVCHFAGARVSRFLPDGELDYSIGLPVPNITKCCFGGAAMQTLYITTAATGLEPTERARYPLSGGLFSVDVPFTGLAATTVPLPQC